MAEKVVAGFRSFEEEVEACILAGLVPHPDSASPLARASTDADRLA